jgi:hypothetical protein
MARQTTNTRVGDLGIAEHSILELCALSPQVASIACCQEQQQDYQNATDAKR